MKKLTIAIIMIMVSTKGWAKQFTVTLPDDKCKIMEDNVADIQDWLQTALTMRAANSEETILRKEQERAMSEEKALPATRKEIIDNYFNQPGYKNKKARDLELENKIQAILNK